MNNLPVVPPVAGLTPSELLTFLYAMTPEENKAYWASLTDENLEAHAAKLRDGIKAIPRNPWWVTVLLWLQGWTPEKELTRRKKAGLWPYHSNSKDRA